MKKLLIMMLILALAVSCLAGCGSSIPAETEATGKEETRQIEEVSEPGTEPEAESEVAETEVEEETTDEVAVPEMELGTVTVNSMDGSKKLEVTYNDTFYDCTYEVGYDANFFATDAFFNAIFDEEDGLLENYTEPTENFCAGGYFQFHSNYSAQDYYNERTLSLPEWGMGASELTQITISGKDAYVYEEFFNDESSYFTNVMFEIDDNTLMFVFNNGSLIDENGTILDVEAFFVDAKVVE